MDKRSSDRPPARRPGGRNARVRARILDATAELAARDGIAGFRYEEVAELAGVHRTSVYRNWPDREELVTEALLQYAEDLASIADTGDLHRDLVDYLMALAGAWTRRSAGRSNWRCSPPEKTPRFGRRSPTSSSNAEQTRSGG